MKRGVVVGADVLSRISDPHDRDSMIYADGAGATIVEAVESDEPVGILVPFKPFRFRISMPIC